MVSSLRMYGSRSNKVSPAPWSAVATGLGILIQLLPHGSVSYRGGFCDLATWQVSLMPIPAPHSLPIADCVG